MVSPVPLASLTPSAANRSLAISEKAIVLLVPVLPLVKVIGEFAVTVTPPP